MYSYYCHRIHINSPSQDRQSEGGRGGAVLQRGCYSGHRQRMDRGVSDVMKSVYIYYTIIYTGIHVHYLFVHVLLYTVVCTSTPLYTSTALYVYTMMNTPNILSYSIVYTGMWSFPLGRSRTRRWWASTCKCSSYQTARNKQVRRQLSVVIIMTLFCL